MGEIPIFVFINSIVISISTSSCHPDAGGGYDATICLSQEDSEPKRIRVRFSDTLAWGKIAFACPSISGES
jgi:hypothetical protein